VKASHQNGPAVGWSDRLDLLFQYRQLRTNARLAKAQLMIDVMMSVDVGSVVPVYGSQRGPESDAAMIRESNNQNLRFVDGRFIVGKPAARREFRRRRCKTMSGMKHTGARIRAHHWRGSERPSGSENTLNMRNTEPKSDRSISSLDGFMRSNEN